MLDSFEIIEDMMDNLVTIINDANNSAKDIIDKIDKSGKMQNKINIEEWTSDAIYDENSDVFDTDDDCT